MPSRTSPPALTRRQCLAIVGGALVPAVVPVTATPWQQGEGWTSLFDGQTMGGWEQTAFGGEGPVRVRDGAIVLGFGDPLTGVTWTGDYPAIDYEIALEAARLAGNDFFCGLTFPVASSFCSLIVGGWGGTTVGLSTIDGLDASTNETNREMRLDDEHWYAVRVRVEHARIRAWLDEEPVVDVATAGKRIGIRPEVDPSRPLGIASYRTRAGLRAIRLRSVVAEE
jgi:3-keto-disaccharide hydrolase